MGHLIDDKKHIENDNNKNKNEKYKTNSYEKIKDIVMNNDDPKGHSTAVREIIVKKNIKNIKNNDIKKPIVDIGL